MTGRVKKVPWRSILLTHFNPTVSFYTPWFPVFTRYRKGTMTWNGFKKTQHYTEMTVWVDAKKNLLCDALRDFVTFVQFKKCEKHPWRSVTFGKVAGLLESLFHKFAGLRACNFIKKRLQKACNSNKSNNPQWVFFTFFKLYKWYQIAQNLKYALILKNDYAHHQKCLLKDFNKFQLLNNM